MRLFEHPCEGRVAQREQRVLRSYARHHYDLYQLAGQNEVIAMLQSEEYATIKTNYDQISLTYFARNYFFPDGMDFARSDALFPSAELAEVIRPEYEQQCRTLCYGAFPPWADVQARFHEIPPFKRTG